MVTLCMAFQVTDKFRVRLGGNTYIDVGTLVAYRGQRLFDLKRHEDGYLGIYFDLYDAQGVKIATVKRNELYFTRAADRERYEEFGSSDSYLLRDKSTGIPLVEIRKRGAAQPNELEVSVRLYTPDGTLFDATPTSTNLGGVTLIDNVFIGLAVGIAFG